MSAKRIARLLCCLFCTFAGCEAMPPAEQSMPPREPPPETPVGLPCPLVIDDGLGFTVTLPCDLSEETIDPGSPAISGAWEHVRAFSGQQQDIYIVGVLSPLELPTGTSTSTFDGVPSSFTYDGTLINNNGAVLLLASDALNLLAVTALADSRMLFVIVSRGVGDISARNIFSTISLHGTNGTLFIDAVDAAVPRLAAPIAGDFVLLDDGSVWEVSNSNLRLQLARWSVGDGVWAHDDFYILNTNEWRSVRVEFVDVASILEVVSVDSSFSCTDVELLGGSIWTACTDAGILDQLQPGDSVAVHTNRFGGNFVMPLTTGESARVIR